MERPTLDEMLVTCYAFLLEEFTDPHAVAPIKFKAFALQTSPGVMQSLLDEDQKLLDAKNAPPAVEAQSEPAYAPGHQPKPGQRAADTYRGNARVWNPNGTSKDLERKPTVPLPKDSPFRRLGEVVLPKPQQQAASLIESTGLPTTSQGTQTTGVQVADKPLTAEQRMRILAKAVSAAGPSAEELSKALQVPFKSAIPSEEPSTAKAGDMVSNPSDTGNEALKAEIAAAYKAKEREEIEKEFEILPTLTEADLALIVTLDPKSVTEAYNPNRLRAYLAEKEIPFKDTASDRQVAGALITWLKGRPSGK